MSVQRSAPAAPATTGSLHEALRLEVAQALSLAGLYRALLEEHDVPVPADRTGEQTVMLHRRLRHLVECGWRVCEGRLTVDELRAEYHRLHREQPLFVS